MCKRKSERVLCKRRLGERESETEVWKAAACTFLLFTQRTQKSSLITCSKVLCARVVKWGPIVQSRDLSWCLPAINDARQERHRHRHRHRCPSVGAVCRRMSPCCRWDRSGWVRVARLPETSSAESGAWKTIPRANALGVNSKAPFPGFPPLHVHFHFC